MERWLSREERWLLPAGSSHSQHPQGGSQVPVTQAPGDLMPSSGHYGYCMCMVRRHSSRQNMQTHKIKINKCKRNGKETVNSRFPEESLSQEKIMWRVTEKTSSTDLWSPRVHSSVHTCICAHTHDGIKFRWCTSVIHDSGALEDGLGVQD